MNRCQPRKGKLENPGVLEHLANHAAIFCCPACRGNLAVKRTTVSCLDCSQVFPVQDGIPLLFFPHDPDNHTTAVIKDFYEATPFPNYEGLELLGDLMAKSERNRFPKMLNEQIPFAIRVLEVGCGTGQLTNFLGAAHRSLFGTDICLNSLRLAEDFRQRNGLNRVGFYQMNLFKPTFKEESFPLVICNGVLHHTADPFGGFKSIARLVKKGGYIIIGLYNKYGRLLTDVRRGIFKLTGDRCRFLDPYLKTSTAAARQRAWFQDQYHNPHESKHTYREVLRWFQETGFSFVNSIPKARAFSALAETERLFQVNPRGNILDHFIVQLQLIFTGASEGGFFTMIGRKTA